MTISNPRLSFAKARFAKLNEDQSYNAERVNTDNWSVDSVHVPPEIMVPGVLVINEIDSDTAGTDVLEFVEIYDGGLGNMSLNGYVLVFFNGSNDLSYAAFDLDGFFTDANGYFVAGNTAVAGVDLVFGGNILQNGQDAVALYLGNAADFPTNTAPTTTNLVDAIVYDTADADDAALLAALGETTQYDEGAGGAGGPAETNALARVPNETGGFVAQAPTPGAANVAAGETQTVVFNPTSVTQAEGDSGTTIYTFTVTRTGGTTGQLDFSGTFANGTTDNADYVGGTAPTVFSGSILDGQTSATVTVSVQGDDTIESNESFTLTLTNVSNAAANTTEVIGANNIATGNITNDDAFGSLSIDDVTLAEGNSGTTAFTFTVLRADGDEGAVGATWTLNAPGGALLADAADFDPGQLGTGTVSFADGETSQTITILVQGDVTFEDTETFLVTLSAPTGGATLGNANGTGTIANDDAAPAGTLNIDDVSLAEGNSGPTTFTFTVTRTDGSAGAVTADYTISAPGGAGNANSADFVSGSMFSGQVSFADGETSRTITIDVQGDTDFEANEAFTVTLSNATGGAAIGDGTGAGTIQNDDIALPSATIGDVAVAEGNDGVSYLVFTVTLSSAPGGPVTLDFTTAPGSATAGSDYVEYSGQISFAIGETTQTISVPIIGDTSPEVAETLTVTLSNASGATIGDASATGTITNDDGSGYYSLAGGSFTQNWTNTGQITANDNWTGVPFIIGYRGDDLTTATGTDARTITTTSNVVDVNANQTNPDTFVTGGVTEFEIANPTIALTGSGTGDAPYLALYMDATGRSNVRVQANLRDIDGSADDAAQQINIQYRTSATGPWLNAPGGYFADVTTAGSATQVTAVDITLPADANGAATLEIRFMTTNAAGNDEQVGIDDIIISSQESAPILSIGNTAIFEGDAGNSAITFTVTRSGTTTGTVTADYTVTFPGGITGATADDFAVGQLFTGQVSFADGQSSATITLQIDGDVGPEADENFTVTLSNPVGGLIGDGVATGTIINDDGPPPLVTINDVTVTEGDSGTSLMTFTVTRTGGTGAFDIDWQTFDGTGIEPSDYLAGSGTLQFGIGVNTQTISITINGDTASEVSETLEVHLSNATNFALIADAVGVGTIAGDDPIYIHDIQGTAYFSPILAAEGITGFNIASTGFVTVRAVVTAVDNVGTRQGYYITEEATDWDGNTFTSEGIFVMTRNDANVGTVVSGVSVGDLVQLSAQVMEYQAFSTMPRTVLVNSTGLQVISTGNALPTVILTNMPNEVMTPVAPDYTDSSDGVGDTFDASVYALSYFETVEGMLVTIPNMVVADGFVSTSGGDPFLQAYSLDSANADQINSRGGYTIAGDPPIGPPDTAGTGDDTHNGGQVLHDGDVNPDIIELDFTDFATSAPAGLLGGASMGDLLGDVTGIIDFDFTDRKLFVTAMEPGGFVDGGSPTQETTALGNDDRSLTVATFNVENLDPGDGAARFTALANAIANNLNAPDILCIEEMQDNNGATASGGADASVTWQMLVDALNLATGKVYQWVDQEPNAGTEGGEPGGNIRVGFLYDTGRVQLGDLAANATLAERRMYTDRIGDGVRDAGDLIAYDDSMLGAEIVTADWSGTRRSLLGEFTFNGNTVFLTANHWPAKGGSGEFWQFDQAGGDPDNSGWDSRNDVAQDVYSMLNLIQSTDANAGIVAGGDFNDFYFYRPLTTVTGYTMADGTARVGGARFDNLTLTLSEAERYTYTFDGRSQAIDHIIANGLLSAVATYDVVHLNTGFNPTGSPALSDHDPGLSSYDYRNFSEVLVGTSGNDLIAGFGGNDNISTGQGNDNLNGGTGIDTLAGGTGDDLYFVDHAGDVVIEVAGEGDDRVGASVSYVLAAGVSVETLVANPDSATASIDLSGNEFGQTIVGNQGNNLLRGFAGADQLIGLGGHDILIGGFGADVLRGGLGNDIYGIDEFDQLFENAGEGDDTAAVSATASSYYLNAGSSIETLCAVNQASTAAQNLTANELGQSLFGSEGANVLNGGGGNDLLMGYGGADIYLFNTALGAGNVDVIADLVHGTDRIALENAVFTGLQEGNLGAEAFVVGSAAGDANDRIIYNQATGQLFFDADGNGAGAAVLFATLNGSPTLTVSDFLVI